MLIKTFTCQYEWHFENDHIGLKQLTLVEENKIYSMNIQYVT